MKNIFLIILFLFVTCTFKSSTLTVQKTELDTFIESHNINKKDIEPYLQYQKFCLNDFFSLENLRISNNYSYLETINHFYSSNTALFLNSNIVLVNKNHFLNNNYCPELIDIDNYPVKVTKYNMQIKKEVILAYLQMIDDLELEDLYIFSAYRSYNRQYEIYTNAKDLNYVAIPGSSEHQTGLVLDVSTLQHGLMPNFQYSNEYKLLVTKCHYYGFIIRYPKNKEYITGYSFEPWHLRYVGKEASTYIMTHNITLEEYIYQNFEI